MVLSPAPDPQAPRRDDPGLLQPAGGPVRPAVRAPSAGRSSCGTTGARWRRRRRATGSPRRRPPCWPSRDAPRPAADLPAEPGLRPAAVRPAATPRAGRPCGRRWGSLAAARRPREPAGYEVLVFGDYAIAPVQPRRCFPTLRCWQAGLLNAARRCAGMLYPDFHTSRAFAMVDHEIAHVYVRDPADVPAAPAGAGQAWPAWRGAGPATRRRSRGAGPRPTAASWCSWRPRARWLAYPWWTDKREAPGLRHARGHPQQARLRPVRAVLRLAAAVASARTPSRIRGSHGRAGTNRQIAWASDASHPVNRRR